MCRCVCQKMWCRAEQRWLRFTLCAALHEHLHTEWVALQCREAPLPAACQPPENCGMRCLDMTLPWVHDSQPQPDFFLGQAWLRPVRIRVAPKVQWGKDKKKCDPFLWPVGLCLCPLCLFFLWDCLFVWAILPVSSVDCRAPLKRWWFAKSCLTVHWPEWKHECRHVLKNSWNVYMELYSFWDNHERLKILLLPLC